jgi:hypothetical protein
MQKPMLLLPPLALLLRREAERGLAPRLFFRSPYRSKIFKEGTRMKSRTSVLLRLGLVMATIVLLFPSSLVLAQDNTGTMPTAAFGPFFAVMIVFWLAAYVYFSLAFQTIATKTNTANAWLAWVPIANIILMLNIARKPLWWILLLFVPLLNIVILIMIFMAIAEARHKPSWWGILLIVPVVNFIVPGYLAWSD